MSAAQVLAGLFFFLSGACAMLTAYQAIDGKVDDSLMGVLMSLATLALGVAWLLR